MEDLSSLGGLIELDRTAAPSEGARERAAGQLDDALAHPARSERPRVGVRRRAAIAVLVAIAVAAPLAFAAQRTQLIDLGFGDPAPLHVKRQLDHMLPPAYGPREGPPDSWNRMNIVKGSERLVARTTLPDGSVAHLYTVRLKNGGVCFEAIGKPFGGGGCGKASAARRAGSPLLAAYGSQGPTPKGSFALGATYSGRVIVAGASSILVHYKDGPTDTIALEHGWFLYAVPAAHERWGHQPVRLDILGASGTVVAHVDDPFGLQRPKGTPERPVAPKLLARIPLGWHGGVLELSAARSSKGNRCVRVLNTVDLIQTRSWECGAFVGRGSLASGPGNRTAEGSHVALEMRQFTKEGSPDGYAYFRGWVSAPVTSLELRFQDSTTQRLAIHDGFVVYVVPKRHWAPGTRPSYVIGRNAAGRAIYRRFLYPKARCTYPGPDPRCAQIIIHGG